MSYTEEQKKEIAELIRERDKLLKEWSGLLDKWAMIQRRIWINHGKSSLDYPLTEYELSYYSQEDRDAWSDTFFFNHHDWIETTTPANLSQRIQKLLGKSQTFEHPLLESRDFYFERFFTLCAGIIPCETGPRLMLQDPYGCITTSILEDLPLEIAQTWLGQIIDCEIGFRKGSDEHPLRNAYPTGFHKYD